MEAKQFRERTEADAVSCHPAPGLHLYHRVHARSSEITTVFGLASGTPCLLNSSQ